MKQNSGNVGFPRTRNFLRLWSAVAQRMFPFMMEELGELDDMARLFVMLCESVVKPEDFDYANRQRSLPSLRFRLSLWHSP